MNRFLPFSLRRNSQAGMTMIEVMIASGILVISSLSIIALVITAIATNNRNKIDSTGTMLAQSVLEQIASTLIGTDQSQITDCDGTDHEIYTEPGGAGLNGSDIDFAATTPGTGYAMNFVVNSPCTTSGTQRAVYEVRWNVQIVGAAAGTPTNSYLITVGARMQNQAGGNMYFSLPINLQMMAGN